MHHRSMTTLLEATAPAMAKSPTAVVMAEDDIEVHSTLLHLERLGFGTIILLALPDLPLAPLPPIKGLHRLDWNTTAEDALTGAVNQVIEAAQGGWVHYCYNAEYLFFPFCEGRSIRDLVTFQAEERRDSVLTYVLDLYPNDLTRYPDGVSTQEAYLDRSGYYALARPDPANHHHPKDRQLDFHGGLRWRFEEHIPFARRRIDRIGVFRAAQGVKLLEDHRINIEEYNTYACPWHNNITAAICSFRTAKALRSNPGSREQISSFRWRESLLFEWNSQQLLDLGLIEPGQWF